MIEQFEDPRVKVPPPLSQRDPLCKTVQPPKNENNDTEEKLASVQHTLVILSPPLSSSCVLQPLTRNSTKPPRARMHARVHVEMRGCVRVSTSTMRSWPYCGERLVGQGWPEIKR